jgi:hypothetical protein
MTMMKLNNKTSINLNNLPKPYLPTMLLVTVNYLISYHYLRGRCPQEENQIRILDD